jgi:hypothetical protein
MAINAAHRLVLTGAFAVALVAGMPATGQDTDTNRARLAALEGRLEALEHEIQMLEDIKAIKRLQRAYGYYVDKKLSSEVAGLFAESATVELGGMGVYVGRERIAEFYERLMGGEGLAEGELYNHMILQGVVNVDEDGTRARGRWRALIQLGQHGESAVWAEGPYENEYVKEDGVWKIQKLHYSPFWHADYDKGWARTEPMSHLIPTTTFPDDPFGPDELVPGFAFFPATDVVPFHYPHPVTGRPW